MHQNEDRLIIADVSLFLDYLFYFILFGFVFFIFCSARDNFSYDHASYMRYFEAINAMTLVDIFSAIQGGPPYIYVAVSSFGLLEIGFVLAAKAAFYFTNNPVVAYAAVATLSFMARVYFMRRLGLNWVWVILINIPAITLFEANAVRAGCALTLIVVGGYQLLQGRGLVAAFVYILSLLFHVQSAFVLLFFFIFWFLYEGFVNSRTFLAVVCVVLFFSGLIVAEVLSLMGIGKLNDYQGMHAAAIGLNSVSLTALLLVGSVISMLIFSQEKLPALLARDGRVLLPFLMTAIPALSALLFAATLGPVGDRLWQFSFILFSIFMLKIKFLNNYRILVYYFLVVSLLVYVFLVVLEYPLSNFFYPIVPYVDIIPLSS